MYHLIQTPSSVIADLARRHKQLRKSLNMSQQELAERAGVSLGSLKRFEQTGKISLESLLKLAHIMDRLSEFENLFKPLENLDRIEKLFSDKTRGK